MDLNLAAIDFKFLPQEEQVNFFCEITSNISLVCRVCLEKSCMNKTMSNIFEGPQPIFTMIMSCAAVQITQDDGLPNTICNKCLNKLTMAWQFKTQCENSDARLRQCYSSNLTNEISSYDTSVKEELLYIEIRNENAQITSQNQADFISNNQSEKAILEYNHDKTKTDKRNKQRKLDKDKLSKESKIHQCDTCGKTFKRREYLSQHIRIHTGEKPYVCHLCEKRFVNSGHLTTHMRTHTGERPHICSLCPKTFSTRQELNKHTMVHNGERPFLCTTCNKRFGSSSNLYSHLRHHTGEKNYTCEHCGKAFYTKQELKQHLVVHTGLKAYICDICNKRFSQLAHLRRHTKIHM